MNENKQTNYSERLENLKARLVETNSRLLNLRTKLIGEDENKNCLEERVKCFSSQIFDLEDVSKDILNNVMFLEELF